MGSDSAYGEPFYKEEHKMREILFRGKSLEDDGWVRGYLVNSDDREHRSFIVGSAEFGDDGIIGMTSVEINPETMGQFTGLCDANGAKVFEGDILREQRNEGRVGVVTYNKRVAAFCIMDGNSFYWLNEGDPNRSSQLVYSSIIGNIFDSPELLEMGK